VNKISIKTGGALLCTLLFCISQAALGANDNYLKHPSFELQLPTDQGAWNLFDQSRFSSKVALSGSRSLFHWGFSRTVTTPPFLVGNVSGSYQEFAAAPGSRWRLTGYDQTPTTLEGKPAFGIVQLSFFDSRGNDLGTVETGDSKTQKAKISNQINRQTPAGKWILLDTGIATAAANSATVQAFRLYVDYSGSNTSQGVYFDDLTLCALEEANESTC
jgi:hypothetical protein